MPDVLTKSDVHENDMFGDTLTYEEWDRTAVIADANGSHYRKSWRDDAPLLEFGTCDECNTDVVSWAKEAVCPNCNSSVTLT